VDSCCGECLWNKGHSNLQGQEVVAYNTQ